MTTMKNLSLGRFRQAGVWIDDRPSASYEPINTIIHTVVARSRSSVGSRSGAIELFVPLGARSMYGLLGGQFEPDGGERLAVQVSFSGDLGRPFIGSLASESDDVRIGFPIEYANAVFSGIDVAKSELGEVASGRLIIDCAAHGAISSSIALYESLVAVLIKLINLKSERVSDSDLIDLFPRWLK
jgi:hypothetical protein